MIDEVKYQMPKVLTVRDLKLFLAAVEGENKDWKDSQVWLSRDEEGNGYRPLYEGAIGIVLDAEEADYGGYPVGSLVIG